VGGARLTAEENGIPVEAASDPEKLMVTPGTYSEESGVFAKGVSDTNNAVRVELNSVKQPLLFPWIGLGDQATVSASAMAYLVPWGMASLAENESIQLQGGFYRNGNIFAAGDIKVAGSPRAPAFENVRLFARGNLLQCPVTYWHGLPQEPNWNAGSPFSVEYGRAGTTRTVDAPPMNERHFASLRASAAVVYTPAQAGQDGVFFGKTTDGVYFFDLSEARTTRRIIVFDGGSASGTVRLMPKEDGGLGTTYVFPPHTPLGNRVENVTFITNLPVYVADGNNWGSSNEYHLGAPGARQAIVITTQRVEFYPAGMYIDGITFRCGGDFTLSPPTSTMYSNLVIAARIISDGSITTTVAPTQPRPVDFTFAAPAPPPIVRLPNP
jgi:hypothetical protein